MRLSEKSESFREGCNLVCDHVAMFDLLQQDRTAVRRAISNLIATRPPEVVDRFERILLQQSVLMITPDSRRRVMDLYAWLKVVETRHYGRFRSFQEPA